MDLIGFPESDYEEVVQYHEAISAFFFSSPPEERQPGYAQKITELESYIATIIEQHRQAPQDDLIGFILESGEPQYSAAEFVSLISFDIFAAGIGPGKGEPRQKPPLFTRAPLLPWRELRPRCDQSRTRCADAASPGNATGYGPGDWP